MSGCADDYYQNGDLDFDGTPYYPEWPTGPNPTSKFPGSFVQNLPTTGGAQYSKFFLQSDIALSESTCQSDTTGCTVPPSGPGDFYPYWTRVTSTAVATRAARSSLATSAAAPGSTTSEAMRSTAQTCRRPSATRSSRDR